MVLYFATFFTGLYAESTTLAAKANGLIVTISGQKVMTESETGKAIQVKLQDEQKKLTAPLEKDKNVLQGLEKKLTETKKAIETQYAEFEKTSKMLSAEAREQKAEGFRDSALKFEDMQQEFNRKAQSFEASAQKVEKKMNDLYQKEMTKLDGLVKQTINELAQKHGWEIVLMEESVVYANPKSSKTSMVIEELDKKTKALNQAKKQALEKEIETLEKDI